MDKQSRYLGALLVGALRVATRARLLVPCYSPVPVLAAPALLAGRSYDAETRDLDPLRKANQVAAIPPKRHRKIPRDYDCDFYAALHLIRNFFGGLKQYR